MRTQPSILHVDLDAFYASVEQLHKPSLRGKPVVVGGVGVRGVVSTASYEARAFGVHSALATGIARRRAPNAAYLIPRFGAYQAYSEVVMALMHDLSPLVEPLSMDEAFVDVGPLLTTRDPIESAQEVRGLAAGLRTRIREATGLTASVGAGSSKLIAKIASDADKPDGLVVVEPGTEQEWLDPQPVRALWGVGPATAERLRRIGATTVAELRSLSEGELVAVLGSSHGGMLYAVARGQDDREVHTEREMKSISVEDTFATDLLDPSTIHAEMDRLVGRLATRLRRAGRTGRTITIKVRGHDFTTVSRSETAAGPTDDPGAIRAATRRMLPGAVEAATRDTPGVRLLGVGVSGLADWAQAELFGDLEGDEGDEGFEAVLEEVEAEAEAGQAEGEVEPATVPGAGAGGAFSGAADADAGSGGADAGGAEVGSGSDAGASVAPGSGSGSDPGSAEGAGQGSTSDPGSVTDPADPEAPVHTVEGERAPRQFGPTPGAVGPHPRWLPGQDVRHDEFGAGWVQGSGVGRVTVRLEAPGGEPGRIRTFRADDARLHAVDSGEVAREALASFTAD